ncbi:MAG: serine kinase [Pseudomonadota bacterium]
MPAGDASSDLDTTSHPDGALSLHATSVALDGRALLILGPSGAGKSGLAAQMICLGATLVSDDQTRLTIRDGSLVAGTPPQAPKLLELRGLGLCPAAAITSAAVVGALRISPSTARLPVPEHVTLLQRSIPVHRHPLTADLAAKLILLLRWGLAAT